MTPAMTPPKENVYGLDAAALSRRAFEELTPREKREDLTNFSAINSQRLGWMETTNLDVRWMPRRGRGLTSPNPMVGAVLVREGDVVGRGFHTWEGETHAEAAALAEELIAKDPDRPEYWLLQGNAYVGLEQPQKAAQNFEIVARMGKASPAIQAGMERPERKKSSLVLV